MWTESESIWHMTRVAWPHVQHSKIQTEHCVLYNHSCWDLQQITLQVTLTSTSLSSGIQLIILWNMENRLHVPVDNVHWSTASKILMYVCTCCQSQQLWFHSITMTTTGLYTPMSLTASLLLGGQPGTMSHCVTVHELIWNFICTIRMYTRKYKLSAFYVAWRSTELSMTYVHTMSVVPSIARRVH